MSKNDITGDDIKTNAPSEKYRSGWDKIRWTKVGDVTLTKCAASRDGDCSHKLCPQLSDNEPAASGRSCPIYDWDGHDYD